MTISTDVTRLAQRLKSKQLLVFDFDGVLADSVEVKTAAFAQLYEPYGSDIVTRVVSHHRDHGGMPRYEKFRIYHREFVGEPLDEPGIAALTDAFSKLVKQAVIAAPRDTGRQGRTAKLLQCWKAVRAEHGNSGARNDRHRRAAIAGGVFCKSIRRAGK